MSQKILGRAENVCLDNYFMINYMEGGLGVAVDVLSVSSKGQIVLPMEIRKKMDIKTGSKLAAYAMGDTIMLKMINMPTERDFKKSLDDAQRWAKEAGYEENDVEAIVKSYRKSKSS